MKLQNKLSLVLLAGVLAIYVGSALVQRYLCLHELDHFAANNRAGEIERQWQWVQCVQQATLASLEDAMTQGEMDKFEKILVAQRQVPGLQELALYDLKGRRAYTSIANAPKTELPAELKSQLASSTNLVKRATEESFEIYHPLRAEASCVSCHTDWKNDQFCGAMTMRFSNSSLKQAEAAWVVFENGFSRTNAITTVVTTLVLVVVLAGLVLFTVHRLLTRPLRHAASELLEQSEQVTQSAEQMGNASQTLAEGSTNQAASIEETSASLEQLASMTRRNSETAGKANSLAQQTRTVADKSSTDMQAMNAAMNTIKNSSDDIAKIIKTIDEIAFQTNILALNAAVEAARAGEVGLGFAVVADEVRNLAQRSAQAAKETASKIENAIANTGHGVALSNKVTSTLEDIVTKARQLDDLAAEVAGASGEQTQGITQINTAIGQMDKITQANAATSEQTAATAEELNAQAETMKTAVHQLLRLVTDENQIAPAKSGSMLPGNNGSSAHRNGAFASRDNGQQVEITRH